MFSRCEFNQLRRPRGRKRRNALKLDDIATPGYQMRTTLMLAGDRRAACPPPVETFCGNQGSLNGKCRSRMHRSCICGKGFHEEHKRRPPKRSTTAIGALVLAHATVPKLFARF